MLTLAEEEVRAAVDFLLKVASKHNAIACGYVFAAKPQQMLFNFGNCSDADEIQLYSMLCSISKERQATGKCIIVPPIQQES